MENHAEIMESDLEIFLYFSANFGELQNFYKDTDVYVPEQIYGILLNIYHLCKTSGGADQIHRVRRVLRALERV